MSNPVTVLYFVKELVSVPFMAGGSPMSWEALGDNKGRAKLPSNDPRAADLISAAQKQIGGVIQVNAQQFEDVKKNNPYVPPVRRENPVQPIPRHGDLFPTIPKKRPGVPPAVGVNPNPAVMRHPAPPQQPSFAAAARSPFPPPAPSGEVPTPTAPAWQPQTENPIVIPVSGNKGPTVDLNPPPFKPRRGRIPNAVKAAMALQAEAAAQGVAA